MSKISDGFLHFVKETPNAYYCVKNVSAILAKMGFQELKETEEWDVRAGKYYVVRNDASIIAFKLDAKWNSFSIVASHGDSPSLHVKSNPDMLEEGYVQLNTEIYGGPLRYTWLDRPLSVAGRVTVKTEKGYAARPINIQKDLLVIPSLAIHMNREANDGLKLNPQKHMLPIYALSDSKKSIKELLEKEIGSEILDYDLYLYNRDEPKYTGENNEFILSPRIDNLGCAYTSLMAFLAAKQENACQVYACFNNEEIGSDTLEGAGSTFLKDVLSRICDYYGKSYLPTIAKSFLVSADNGHAIHPNYPEMCDPTNQCHPNGGIVIKHHVNYTSDGFSSGVLKDILTSAGIPYQEFSARSDARNGGTLGKISLSQVSLHSVDVGMAQLAMHSANEFCGSKDIDLMVNALTAFYNSDIRFE